MLERNCGVGVVDVHDTNMGFKPPCHFVIVHMNPTFVVVVLVGYLMELTYSDLLQV